MTPQKTFLYNAHACALGGFFTRPVDKLESVASLSLPLTGGSGSTEVLDYNFQQEGKLIIHIDRAYTVLSSSQDAKDGSYNTSITTTVEGLKYTNRIEADKIVATISSHHPGNDDETNVTLEKSVIENLKIDGELVVTDPDSDLPACPSFAAYKAKKGNGLAIGKSGLARCAVYKKISHKYVQQIDDQQVIVVPDFGKVYLGEVYMKHSNRRLTMLRLQLGSPQAGSVSICGGEGNGLPFP